MDAKLTTKGFHLSSVSMVACVALPVVHFLLKMVEIMSRMEKNIYKT